MEVGAELIHSHLEAVPIRHLCVRPTGGGKSLVFQTVADVVGGVTICICPLLSLGADQAKKVLSKTHLDCRSITAFHLDELSTDAIKKLKGFFQSADYTKSNTSIIIFASPQAITNQYKPFIDYLIKCNLISFVVVDEIHLAVHFGCSFRKEFLLLKDSFFLKVNPNIPMAFFTATCSEFIQSSVEKMFGFEFNRSHWPSSSEMMHRSVGIHIAYTTRSFQFVTKTIKDHLTNHPSLPNKVIAYSNRRVRIFNFADKLEQLLDRDDDFKKVDVLTLVGTLTKEEKAAYIRMFINGSSNPQSTLDIRVLCATSGVGNAGIDSPDIRSVYRIDFPPSILDFVQEKGRAGRRPGALPSDYSYIVCISLESFLFLFKRIINPDDEVNDETYRLRQIEDLLLVTKLFTSKGKCYSATIESIMGNPSSPSVTLPNCGNCPSCRKQKLFPPIHREGVGEVIMELFCFSSVQYKTLDAVISFIRSIDDAPYKLFRKRVKKLDPLWIKKLLLILVAAGILEVAFEKEIEKGGDLVFKLARVGGNALKMALLMDEFWDHIDIIT